MYGHSDPLLQGGDLNYLVHISPHIHKPSKGIYLCVIRIINCAIRINYLPNMYMLVLGYPPNKTSTVQCFTTALKGIHQS